MIRRQQLYLTFSNGNNGLSAMICTLLAGLSNKKGTYQLKFAVISVISVRSM